MYTSLPSGLLSDDAEIAPCNLHDIASFSAHNKNYRLHKHAAQDSSRIPGRCGRSPE